ncbi:DUF2335 domain-containing protein [Aerococcaceae bacterium DSM 111176]|nr:DUF2335 domain-containing protein [Aerococcaceae bacterium DSM 111176]
MENKNTDKQLQEIQQEIEEVHSDVEVIDKRLDDELDRYEQVIEYHKMTMRSAPLPSAEELEHYEKIQPGMAKEILEMAKMQQDH